MDSMSDFERMIEDLTEKNLELKSKISEYQQEISDLEYAQVDYITWYLYWYTSTPFFP